ncbi:glycerophosphodiester phosphodiesterase [Candidatus Parcubacteria bacterium]|jgi:glycerophosphoryl diester phosphodiesterase|nr:MAG: glycerophosphodiester phosphodiesterase [Candidatus Parcubacteria bacterium]
MFLKIAHRGASKKEPENTLRSFRRALSLGSTFIECDVHICKTGELVVMHDETVDRTTNGRGKIHNKTYQELLALDDGVGEHVPRLQEVIELVHNKARINIELKGRGTGHVLAYTLAAYYSAGWKLGDFFISSFSRRELRAFRKLDRETPVGYLLTVNMFGAIHFAKKINAYSVNPNVHRVTKHFVNKAHKNNLKVFVYTVDTPEQAKKMKEMGVDGVFSDCPEEI